MINSSQLALIKLPKHREAAQHFVDAVSLVGDYKRDRLIWQYVASGSVVIYNLATRKYPNGKRLTAIGEDNAAEELRQYTAAILDFIKNEKGEQFRVITKNKITQNTMITTSNYYDSVAKIGVNTLPDVLQKSHDLVNKVTQEGRTWDNYNSNATFKRMIDLYLTKLNEYAIENPAAVKSNPTVVAKVKKAKPPVQKSETIHAKTKPEFVLPAILKLLMPKHQQSFLKTTNYSEHEDTLTKLAEIAKTLPAHNDNGGDSVVYLHYFYGGMDWYVTEYHKTDGIFYGFANIGDDQNAEWGTVYISELVNDGRIELDFHFEPRPIKEINVGGNFYYEEKKSTPAPIVQVPKAAVPPEAKKVKVSSKKYVYQGVKYSEQEIIDHANTTLHYEIDDNDATPFTNAADALKALKNADKAPKVKKLTKAQINQQKYIDAEKTERLTDDVSIIKRYVSMNDKQKSKEQILSFLRMVQKAILERRVGKISMYSKEVMQIQDNLIMLAKDKAESFQVYIAESSLARYNEIVNNIAPLVSISLLKRYVSLIGKRNIVDKAQRLVGHFRNAINNKHILPNDKYAEAANNAYMSLHRLIKGEQQELDITEAELNGLQGIDGLGKLPCKKCEIEKTYHPTQIVAFKKHKFNDYMNLVKNDAATIYKLCDTTEVYALDLRDGSEFLIDSRTPAQINEMVKSYDFCFGTEKQGIGKAGKANSEMKRIIAAENIKNNPFDYRAKVLFGDIVVLRQLNNSPVKKLCILEEWKDAEYMASEMNKNAKASSKTHDALGNPIAFAASAIAASYLQNHIKNGIEKLFPKKQNAPAPGSQTSTAPVNGLSGPDVMTVSSAKSKSFRTIGFTGQLKSLIGDACEPTSIFIYGNGGSGKSSLSLTIADALNKLRKSVLYVAGEQFNTPTFSLLLEKTRVTGNESFKIVKSLNTLPLANFDVIVIDSKDSVGLTASAEFKVLRDMHPTKIWILTSQGTKAGDFTGDEKWRNEVDTMIYCEQGKASTLNDKNRWGGKAEMRLF